ncbi:hypothetical protein M8C21_017603 [Ambrosia artemisiifolia]|uniref:Uncharacterized protein n=1 Tax=Ambrosia artemisiifolia TaxID=4212 RepID=A0AAD5G645_AMBAR|nr:hypothetical protein M8C21_017603 [Ambrosia artemisiifolia]
MYHLCFLLLATFLFSPNNCPPFKSYRENRNPLNHRHRNHCYRLR